MSEQNLTGRVIREPRVGLTHARAAGVRESSAAIIAFVDDDNRLHHEYVARVLAAYNDERVGAAGGRAVAKTDGQFPVWFDEFESAYAVGSQHQTGGRVPYLYGAGLSVRRAAWDDLHEAGFEFSTAGRRGNELLSGEDEELCYALRLAGWQLRYVPDARLDHVIDARRLTSSYLALLHRGLGRTSVYLDPYWRFLRDEDVYLGDWYQRNWALRAGASMAWILRHPSAFLDASQERPNPYRLERERRIGRVKELFTLRTAYRQSYQRVEHARWRRRR